MTAITPRAPHHGYTKYIDDDDGYRADRYYRDRYDDRYDRDHRHPRYRDYRRDPHHRNDDWDITIHKDRHGTDVDVRYRKWDW